ncbi:158R [Iridovirus CN01]|nr:158R [Iridovirus CN01]UPA43537.1 158R [Iridovirus CN01]UPA43734.1 158R [Iridovirus CN01]UPA43895.1 158R [Iridovirus CN01]
MFLFIFTVNQSSAFFCSKKCYESDTCLKQMVSNEKIAFNVNWNYRNVFDKVQGKMSLIKNFLNMTNPEPVPYPWDDFSFTAKYYTDCAVFPNYRGNKEYQDLVENLKGLVNSYFQKIPVFRKMHKIVLSQLDDIRKRMNQVCDFSEPKPVNTTNLLNETDSLNNTETTNSTETVNNTETTTTTQKPLVIDSRQPMFTGVFFGSGKPGGNETVTQYLDRLSPRERRRYERKLSRRRNRSGSALGGIVKMALNQNQ